LVKRPNKESNYGIGEDTLGFDEIMDVKVEGDVENEWNEGLCERNVKIRIVSNEGVCELVVLTRE